MDIDTLSEASLIKILLRLRFLLNQSKIILKSQKGGKKKEKHHSTEKSVKIRKKEMNASTFCDVYQNVVV